MNCTSNTNGDALLTMSSSPFTASQWQELQRQALIYKHILASAPVPSYLLSPSSAASFPPSPTIYLPPPIVIGRNIGCGSVRLGNGPDDEPGRCRRTDGKKWRCARDAEPDQKYCERHLHRGRPRSRKPVEHRKSQTRCKSTVVVSGSRVGTANVEFSLPFGSGDSNDASSYPDWTKNCSENIYTSNHYEEVPNLKYSDHDQNENWCSYLNSDPVEEETCVEPKMVADTTTNSNDSSKFTSVDKLSLSMGLGGPLGEVFQSNKKCCGSDEVSPQDSPSRINYSPSGVIHKALYSDSSSCTSPTFAAGSRPDFVFHWMNLNS